MKFELIIGSVITIISLIAVSAFSGKITKNKKGATSFLVAGAIMGTLVGGSSTIGTAQLAYQYGMSAWWFTLGGGVACLILTLAYAKPLYRGGHTTLTGFVTSEYGKKNGVISAIFSSIGSFINIISQLIAATAVIAVVFPNLSLSFSLIFSAIIMILYIVFGGVKGSGFVGIFKMLLLYISMLSVGLLVLYFCGGLSEFAENVRKIENPENVHFYSLFARGVGKDLGACLSLVLGVVTTQSYAQAIFMAESEKAAIKGALISTVLVPLIGIGGILVGLYMRSMHPEIVSKTALTYFITQYMPPALGGVVLGALFIAVVGTGAGLTLGIATVVKNDVLPMLKCIKKEKVCSKLTEKKLIIVILFFACLLSMGTFGDTILNFAFMSMGLRGAALFAPLSFAIFSPGRVSPKYAMLSIILGPLIVLVFNLWNLLPFDPLFLGVLVSGFIMFIGLFKRRECNFVEGKKK
ncbi:MAG: sodium:solute symporter family protein [Clostridia bacterium]|nr:sodium:solute symporter family protein [Clostridia bacterium]